ncbi:ABC transporter substrate-binding protein [Solwaraspora sp. WMMD791]|uniref:ABC transporter substrate-binding protein n=1 Tax=Solwaraspora sp. WMMD791 TaxID=3016086 RepID=UPI00249B3CB7|nr:ABC transporter substrate-binding protein [Solwaraspora sp. WMMD791]WFE29883.1 ABC transporter substrate-binding protein [Solwaraspora sp. WMMD791]
MSTGTPESRARDLISSVNAQAGPDASPLGILTPLTGPGDPVAGELIVRGASLGATYLRESGIADLRFVVQNDQASAADEGMQRSAVAGLAKLAVVDDVLAVVGQWHLRTAEHVTRTAELLGVPIFVENGHNTITARHRRTLFRTYFSIADRVPMIIDFLAEQKLLRLGIIAPNTVFGSMMADTVEQAAAAAEGFSTVRFDFDQESTTEVYDELRKIKDFEPDVLINCGVVRTNYMVINQATEIGLLPGTQLLVMFPFPMRSDDYWRLAGEAGNLVIWPATTYRPSWPGLTPIGRWFTDRYSASFGSFPPDNALNAFTDVTVIGQALAAAGVPDREALLTTLEAGTFDTWRGPVSFDRGAEHWHHSPPEFMLMQYQAYGQSFDDAAVIHPAATRTATYLAPR